MEPVNNERGEQEAAYRHGSVSDDGEVHTRGSDEGTDLEGAVVGQGSAWGQTLTLGQSETPSDRGEGPPPGSTLHSVTCGRSVSDPAGWA